MKKFMLFALVVAVFASCTQKPESFTITGKIEGLEGKLFLNQVVDGKFTKIDSTDVTDGTFTFNGSVAQPEMLYMVIEGMRGATPIFAMNKPMQIEGTKEEIGKLKITGSDAHAKYDEHAKKVAKKEEELGEAYKAANEAGEKEKLEAIVGEYYAVKPTMAKEFVKANPKCYVSNYLIASDIVNAQELDLEEADAILASIDASMQEEKYYKQAREQVDKMKKVAIGQPLVDFTLPTPDGKELSASEVAKNSKVLLIDFWASWCGPCRRENPNVVAIYNEFHDKGFDVLGVSLDNPGAKDKWLKAIEDDGLIWNQVSDLKGWQCEASQLYAVRGIPHTVLVVDGKIVAKNVRGEDLKAKVAELLN